MNKRWAFLWTLYTAISQAETLSFVDSFIKSSEGVYSWRNENLNIDPFLQEGLEIFLQQNGNPIAGVVVVDIATGHVLAMVQGRNPQLWLGKEDGLIHTALFPYFPAASLFKNVTSAAALEIAGFYPEKTLAWRGPCGRELPSAKMWQESAPLARKSFSFHEAYGRSCNAYYAKLAAEGLGIQALVDYAHRMGWERQLPSDFPIPVSPMFVPNIEETTLDMVAALGAGFGLVGGSAIHMAWVMAALGQEGQPPTLRIFQKQSPHLTLAPWPPMVRSQTAKIMRNMMIHTVRKGTASGVFNSRPYRHLKTFVGGKSGNLSSKKPEGVASWFAGLMPIQSPKIAVAGVVLNQGAWRIRGPHLAAQAFRLWYSKANKKVAVLKKSFKKRNK